MIRAGLILIAILLGVALLGIAHQRTEQARVGPNVFHRVR